MTLAKVLLTFSRYLLNDKGQWEEIGSSQHLFMERTENNRQGLYNKYYGINHLRAIEINAKQ